MKASIRFIACLCSILFLYSLDRAQKPELIVQTGHHGGVDAVVFSPDGKVLASRGRSPDTTIRLWDISTGIEMRSLKSGTESDGKASPVFSPDGKILASWSEEDRAIKLLEVTTGRELLTLSSEGTDKGIIAFSPDGKTLTTTSYQSVTIWEVTTGAKVNEFSMGSDGSEHSALSANGKLVANVSSSNERVINLWEASPNSKLRSLRGHTAAIKALVFGPDGKVLASGDEQGVIRLWDIITGKEIRSYRWHGKFAPPSIESITFSNSGRTLALTAGGSDILVWDIETGSQPRTITIEYRTGDRFARVPLASSIAFSPDGNTLACGTGGGAIQFRDVKTGATLRTLIETNESGTPLVLSADGKSLVNGGGFNGIRLWNLTDGNGFQWFGRFYSDPFALSPDGKALACSLRDELRLIDLQTGDPIRTLYTIGGKITGTGPIKTKEINETFSAVAFSPDGKVVALAGTSNKIKLLNAKTGAALRTLVGSGQFSVGAIAFTPDSKFLAVGDGEVINLWNVQTGSKARILKEERDNADTIESIKSLTVSSDGRLLASGEYKTIRLWGLSSGELLAKVDADEGFVNSVAFSPDGTRIVSGGDNHSIRIWKAESTGEFEQLLSMSGHSGSIVSVAFAPDGTKVFSSSADTTVKIWDSRDGKLLATLIATDDLGWLVITPEGFFDGSSYAWEQIIWRFDNNTFNYAPIEAYFNDFFYPGLLQDVLQGRRPVPPGGGDLSKIDRRRPSVTIALVEQQTRSDAPLSARNVAVRVRVTENTDRQAGASKPVGSGAQDVRLFRNGSLVTVWHGDVLKGKQDATLEATIPLVNGHNNLTTYAFNHDNVKSSDATLSVTGAESLKRTGTAYVLAVGVNVYSNTNYNLKYAVPDAEDFATEIKRQQDTLKKYERVEIIPLYDKDGTKANILKALDQLAAKAQPEDAVIVYFSGHGTAAQQRFYLIPHDLGYQGPRTKLSKADLEAILAHSISDRELEAAFEKIDAGQLLMVIDACNSGQALDSEEKRRGPMNSKGLAQLAYEKGMYILTAAQSYQAAWEASRLGHGFLTYALVEEGLKKGTADKEPKDNQIVLREWLDYATERVPQMQEEKLKDTPQIKDQQGRELEFVFVEGDETIKDPTKRTIQRPRVFYRRELESNPLVIARPQIATPLRN